MKNAKWMLPVMLTLLSGLMAAQSLTSSSVVAKVPFDFMVNNKIIPAGECTVRAVSGDVLAIQNFEARKGALASSCNANASKDHRTVMVFQRYGSQYFLSEIRIQGNSLSYKLPQSRAEAELRAQNTPSSQQTLLALIK
jgi:hypothetical protein